MAESEKRNHLKLWQQQDDSLIVVASVLEKKQLTTLSQSIKYQKRKCESTEEAVGESVCLIELKLQYIIVGLINCVPVN